LWKNKRA